MRARREEAEEKFRHLTNLPTLPEIATRLMTMVNDPRTSTSDVADIIGQDPSLSSKVLRLANSAFYGMPSKITTINHAVVLLGFKVITTIVLSITVFDMFPENKRSRELFDRRAFWLHSLCCGLVAKQLAMHVKRRFLFDPEETFCAGLLHDIGKVVLEQYLHVEFHAALKHARDHKLPMHLAEKKVLGFTHADTAEWLTASWGLPAEILKPLARHHDPELSGAAPDSAGLCHAADWLCYTMGMVIDPAYETPVPEKSVMDALELTPPVIEQLQADIPHELEQSSLFLSLVGAARE
jgi:HD-like signal output (HDOD) protein